MRVKSVPCLFGIKKLIESGEACGNVQNKRSLVDVPSSNIFQALENPNPEKKKKRIKKPLTSNSKRRSSTSRPQNYASLPQPEVLNEIEPRKESIASFPPPHSYIRYHDSITGPSYPSQGVLKQPNGVYMENPTPVVMYAPVSITNPWCQNNPVIPFCPSLPTEQYDYSHPTDPFSVVGTPYVNGLPPEGYFSMVPNITQPMICPSLTGSSQCSVRKPATQYTLSNFSKDFVKENIKIKQQHVQNSNKRPAKDTECCCLWESIHIKTINTDVIIKYLRNKNDENKLGVYLIDCRDPLEFSNGHIMGAMNMTTANRVRLFFLNSVTSHMYRENLYTKKIDAVFYCENSIDRAPKMARTLHRFYRDFNCQNSHNINFPDIYVLTGGYKEFYDRYPYYCDLKAYISSQSSIEENEVRNLQ